MKEAYNNNRVGSNVIFLVVSVVRTSKEHHRSLLSASVGQFPSTWTLTSPIGTRYRLIAQVQRQEDKNDYLSLDKKKRRKNRTAKIPGTPSG